MGIRDAGKGRPQWRGSWLLEAFLPLALEGDERATSTICSAPGCSAAAKKWP